MEVKDPNIKGLLTEREVCSVKYQTEFFYFRQRSDISQYRPNKRGQSSVYYMAELSL